MNKDKYVFTQLVEFLDNNKFRHLVDKFNRGRNQRYLGHFHFTQLETFQEKVNGY